MKKPAYEQIQVNKSLKAIGDEMRTHWNEAGIIQKTLTSSLGNKPFVFLEGPPTANGRPHVGHAMTRTMKDSVLRYHYMAGFDIHRRTGGWDCHGLPVEIEAEKHFGFKIKKEIEDFGIAKFNEYCRESVFRYIDEWIEADQRIGFWVEHEKSYVTLRNEYIESEWWALKSLFDRGLLIRDYKIVPYCPRCETSLSSHEVSQGYDDVKDPSVYVKFKETDHENTYFLAWTTTPWTLPSNQFLAVNENIEYSLVEHEDEFFYVASAVAKRIFGENAKFVKRFTGKELLKRKYEQLIPFLKAPKNTLFVVSGDHVNVDEGTGIVHTSPAFGAEDFEVGKKFGVEMLNPINASGKFNDERLPWNGKFFKDADLDITILLKKENKLLKSEKITHSYPFCYRCGTALIYYPLQAWFIKVSTFRQKLLENNQKINWLPEHLKEGRFGNFLSEAKDWSLSRNRYWGTTLPVWMCKNDHMVAVGSVAELEKLSGKKPKDLHRPYIDEITFKCKECGKTMSREPYVIDTWFDSGSATYAALHYPFDTGTLENNFPINFITEAIDQTRGWFYTLHVISSLLFDQNAYKNALSIDFILDEQGRKMSKSKGNSVFALDFLNEHGPDPVRAFFLSGVPWRAKAIDKKLINETSRKVFGTLANIYSFFASNANLDGYHYEEYRGSNNLLDRWIVSRTNTVLKQVVSYMDSFNMHLAFRSISELIDDLSNFYLRLSRRRFWSDDFNKEKADAYAALGYSIERVLLMLAPLTPFFADYLYLKLMPDGVSVHLQKYPVVEEKFINTGLQNEMSVAGSIMEIVRRLRQENSIKGRQPVTEVLVKSGTKLSEEILSAIAPELNSKDIRFIEDYERPVTRKMRLILQKAAPVLKGKLQKIKAQVENDQGALVTQLEKNGKLELENEILPPEFLEIVEMPNTGFATSSDAKLAVEVFLNLAIDTKLQNEGLAREIVRRIQVMRKELDLQYDQRIDLSVNGDSNLNAVLGEYGDWIKTETLAASLKREKREDAKEWDIDGDKVLIWVKAI